MKNKLKFYYIFNNEQNLDNMLNLIEVLKDFNKSETLRIFIIRSYNIF